MTGIIKKISIFFILFFVLTQIGQLCPQFAMAHSMSNDLPEHQKSMTPTNNISTSANHHEPIPTCCFNNSSHFEAIIDSKIIDHNNLRLSPTLSTSDFSNYLPIICYPINSPPEINYLLNPVNHKNNIKRE